MLEGGSAPGPLKLKGVVGYMGRQNDVIYCHPAERSDQSRAVVYFGGDIQDFAENMEGSGGTEGKGASCVRKWTSEEDNRQCSRWNLDSTAGLLSSCFPASHIVVVRPARIELRTFSCFDNFVPSNNCGVPEHTPTHHSLHHLQQMLRTISDRVRTARQRREAKATDVLEDGEIVGSPEESEPWSGDPELDKYSLTVVGFSKGCVVLNQFIYEFHYLKTLTPGDDTLSRFVDRFTDMYWLDGGHAGDKNTWLTSRCLLETLSRLDIKIHVHVTPYQVRDERRVWIGSEERVFCEVLRAAGADLQETMHFEHEAPSLQKHFQLLTTFCPR